MNVLDRLGSPVAVRLLRSYGFVLALAVAFLLIVLLVPTRDRTVPVQTPASYAPPVWVRG